MANVIEALRYMIGASWEGDTAVRRAKGDITDLGNTTDAVDKNSKQNWASIGKSVAIGAGVAGAALGALAIGAKATWNAINEGADLSRYRDQFERLAESINSTGDAMLGKLKTATAGLMTDAELVAAAGQIMSLGLADTEDAVVRLTTVSGKLGWDMGTVILTMANNSTMRLDSLGLSIEDVTSKMDALKAAGMDADQAFDMAVIQAGEEKILLVGDAADSTAGKMQAFQVAIENAQNAFDEGLAVGVASGIDQIGASALDAAGDVAYLTGRLGELWGTYIGAAAASVAGYAKTQQILDDAVKMGLIDEAGAKQLTNQQVGTLHDPSMFGGDANVAGAHANAVIANLEKQVGEITAQRTALETNSWAKWAANINQTTAATEAATAATENNRAAGALADRQRQEGAKYMQDLANRGLEVANAADEETRSVGGLASALVTANDAMRELSDASGDLFGRLRGQKDFNLGEELFSIGDKAGWSALDMSKFGVTAGLFDQGRADELLNRSYLLQSAEQMIAGGLKGDELWGAVQGLQGQLGEGAGLATEFFSTLDAATIRPDMDMNTDPALVAYRNLQTEITNNPLVATVRVNYENAVTAVVQTMLEQEPQ